MTFQKQVLQTCPNCKEDRLITIESRKTKDSTRRRKRCEFCGYRITTHEVNEEFFKQARQNALLLQQVCKLLNVLPTSIALEEPKCNDCQYNKGSHCEYGFPEYNTPESIDCNWHD